MRAVVCAPVNLLSVLGVAAFLLTGCQAERPVVEPAEPTWSYRDGSEQFSNNDVWERLIPTTTAVELSFDESSVASVEAPTD